MHRTLREEGAGFACDLLDGLEAVSESQYRAWLLEHCRTMRASNGAGERLHLGYLHWDERTMLLLDMANSLDRLNANVIRLGGGKAKSRPILPPGPEKDSVPSRVDGSTARNLDEWMGQAAAFLNNL